jgi:hypothetical protein
VIVVYRRYNVIRVKNFSAGGTAGGLVYPDAAYEEDRIAGPITTLVRKSARFSGEAMPRRSM